MATSQRQSATSRQRTGKGAAWRVLAPSLLMLLGTGAAWPAARAQGVQGMQGVQPDGFHVLGGLGYFHDDNLFRLAQDRPAFGGQRGDSARVGMLGLLLNKPYARQRIQLQARLSRVSFSHFSRLDYDGKDLLGQLDWQLGNHLDGKAGATYVQTLAPYIDVFTQERNLRVQRRQYADAAWRPHPSWRLRGGLIRDKFSYALPVQRPNDRTETGYETGIDYLARSGSSVGLVLRRLDGDYRNRRPGRLGPTDDSFRQDELKARVDWKVTPISSLQMLAGHVRRRHAAPGGEDVSGVNGRLTASLHPREKVRLNAALWREFAALESSLVSFSRNTGASAGLAWDASARVRLDASMVSERRAYDGARLDPAYRGQRDRLATASLGASWAPRRYVQLSATLSHQKRRGAAFLGNGDFKASTVSFNANLQF